MKRLLVTIALAAALIALVPTPAAHAATSTARRVVIVLAPYLTWDDITPTSTPTIWSLAGSGALGDINARSRARVAGEPSSPLEGALTISAGAWAVPSYPAAAAFNVTEHYEVGTAAEAFERTTGDKVGDNRIVYLGMPMSQRVNAERSFEIALGVLASAIETAGGVTAAVGNSDVGYVTGEQRRVRPAALAAMNDVGTVRLGDVSSRLLTENPDAPFGIETDLDRFAEALDEVADGVRSTDGPALVVLDAGDAYRATKFEPQVSSRIAAQHRASALTKLDDVVGLAVDRFPDDVVMVASQSTLDPTAGTIEGLGPFIIHGDGWQGFVTSSSTQRSGVVTNLDVTATVLDVLGLERPVQVLGNEMELTEAPASLEERVDVLQSTARTATAIDTAKRGVINAFVVFTVLALLISAFVLVRARMWGPTLTRWWIGGLRWSLLFTMAVPLASWLMFSWMRWPQSSGEAIFGLLATASVVWVASLLMLRSWPIRVSVGAVSLLTSLVLLVDQWLGAPWSFTNFFGYSPLLAARFYGIGNEAAAILFGSSIVGAAMILDEWPDARWSGHLKKWGLPLFGLVVVWTSAAPNLGANVGVAVWGTVGFVLAWYLMNGHHVTVRAIVIMLVVMVAMVGVFIAIDMFGGGQQTHLARSLASAEAGGLAELWKIVARKAETNMRVLTHTNWAYILIAVVAFLAFMRWRPQGDFADTLSQNPHFADAITVSLVAGLAAYFSEDSGIVIPALEVFYVGVAIVWLMLARLAVQSREDAVR